MTIMAIAASCEALATSRVFLVNAACMGQKHVFQKAI